jgi:hypothetical protein
MLAYTMFLTIDSCRSLCTLVVYSNGNMAWISDVALVCRVCVTGCVKEKGKAIEAAYFAQSATSIV